MKKLVLIISTCLCLSSIVIAQQDSTRKQSSKSEQNPMLPNDKKYSDSSGKYYPYGDSTNTNKHKGNKSRNKMQKADSLNPKPME